MNIVETRKQWVVSCYLLIDSNWMRIKIWHAHLMKRETTFQTHKYTHALSKQKRSKESTLWNVYL